MKPQKIVPLLVLFIAAFHAWLAFEDYGYRWLKAAWRTRELTAKQRTARFLIGDEGYQYIDFLNTAIPEDAAIVKPEAVGVLSQQNNLQYLLMPRAIPSCPCSNIDDPEQRSVCTTCLNKPSHFVLSVGDYPDPTLVQDSKIFIPSPVESDTLYGFYAPESELSVVMSRLSAADGTAVEEARHLPLLELSLVALLLALGYLIARVIAPNADLLLSVIVSPGLGLGLITFPQFIVGWSGLPVTAISFITIMALLIFVSALIIRVQGIKLFPKRMSFSMESPYASSRTGHLLAFASLIIIAVLFASALTISIGRSYSTYDGIANWALKGYAIAEFDTIFAGRDWGGHQLAYPQNIHLGTALFESVTGDVLPASKLLHPLFYLSMILIVMYFLLRYGGSYPLAVAGSSLVAGLPFLYFHSTLGFANVIFSAYLISGILLAEITLREQDRGFSLLTGTLFGLAAWTRPEGIYFGGSLIGIMLIFQWVSRSKWRPIALALPAFLFMSSTWQLFGSRHQAGDEIGQVSREFFNSLSTGALSFGPFGTLLTFSYSQLTKISNWGLAFLIVPVALTATLFVSNKRNYRANKRLWLIAAVTCLLPLSLFIVVGFVKSDYQTFLRVSYDRAMIPGIVLSLTVAIHMLDQFISNGSQPA